MVKGIARIHWAEMPYITTDDRVDIYYEDRGTGEPVVFVHGWAVDHRVFDRQVDALTPAHRVVTYDARGHGASGDTETFTLGRFAEDLRTLVQYLALEDPTIVAWSMGSLVAFEYVDRYGPDALDRLCLVEATPKILKTDGWGFGPHGEFGHADGLDTLRSIYYDWEGFVERFFAPQQFPEGYDAPRADRLTEVVTSTSPHTVVGSWLAYSRGDYREFLPEVAVPSLVVYGGESQVQTPETSEFVAAELPDATLESFEEAGHALFVQQPDRYNDRLRAFLE